MIEVKGWFSQQEITLTEEHHSVTSPEDAKTATWSDWSASIDTSPRLHAVLTEFGPRVCMSRTGKSAQHALDALVGALEAEGYEVS